MILDITVVIFLILVIIVLIVKVRNANKFEYLENKRIAKELSWKLNYYYFNERPYLKEYFFCQRYFATGHFSHSFEGSFQNQKFTLLFFERSKGKDAQSQHYLVVELKEIKNKYSDVLILREEEAALDYRVLLVNKYYKVSLEGNEFNKNFAVYSLHPDTPFYQLAPNDMAELIDMKETFLNELAIQVKDKTILVACDYKTFADYMNLMKSTTDKKDIYVNFLNFALKINKLLS